MTIPELIKFTNLNGAQLSRAYGLDGMTWSALKNGRPPVRSTTIHAIRKLAAHYNLDVELPTAPPPKPKEPYKPRNYTLQDIHQLLQGKDLHAIADFTKISMSALRRWLKRKPNDPPMSNRTLNIADRLFELAKQPDFPKAPDPKYAQKIDPPDSSRLTPLTTQDCQKQLDLLERIAISLEKLASKL